MNSEERDWALNSVICNHCAGKYLCLFKRDFFPDEYMKARCIAFILKVEDAGVPILLVERPFWVWVGADGGFVAKSCVSAVLRFSLWPQSSFPGTSGPLGTPNSQALDPQRAFLSSGVVSHSIQCLTLFASSQNTCKAYYVLNIQNQVNNFYATLMLGGEMDNSITGTSVTMHPGTQEPPAKIDGRT